MARTQLRLRLLRAGLPRLLTVRSPGRRGAGPGAAAVAGVPGDVPAGPCAPRRGAEPAAGAHPPGDVLRDSRAGVGSAARGRAAGQAAVERMSRRVGVILEAPRAGRAARRAPRGGGAADGGRLPGRPRRFGRGARGGRRGGWWVRAGRRVPRRRGLPGARAPEAEASLLRGLVDRATSLEHPIYKMLTKRIVAALALWLGAAGRAARPRAGPRRRRCGRAAFRAAARRADGCGSEGRTTPLDAHVALGLAAVRDEMALGAVLLPVLRHNERHADLYDRLILAAVDGLPEHKAPRRRERTRVPRTRTPATTATRATRTRMSCDAASGWACKKQRAKEGRGAVGRGIGRGGGGREQPLRADRGRRETHAWGTPRYGPPPDARATVACAPSRSGGVVGQSIQQWFTFARSGRMPWDPPPPTALTPRPPAERPPAAPYALQPGNLGRPTSHQRAPAAGNRSVPPPAASSFGASDGAAMTSTPPTRSRKMERAEKIRALLAPATVRRGESRPPRWT